MSMATAAAAIDYVGLLTDTCTIRRYAEGAKDEFSGQTIKTWSDLATGVACRADDILKSKYEITIGKQIVQADYLVFFAVDQDITEKDKVRTVVRDGVTIIAADSNDEDGIGVLLVQTPGGLNHHKEVYLQLTRT